MVQIKALLNFCLISAVAGQFFEEGGAFVWENATVSYRFLNITPADRLAVEKQMEVIENNTCVIFKELTQDEDKNQEFPLHNLYIRGNMSSDPEASCVGPDGEVTYALDVDSTQSFSNGFVLNLNIRSQLVDQEKCKDNPNITGGIMNRLFTVLGIMHTHQRYDRDDFVKYNKDCVVKDAWGLNMTKQFEKFTNDEAPTFGIPYKCNSIMHQTSAWLGKPNCTVLEWKGDPQECQEMGNPTGTPLEEDWQMVNKAQKCAAV
jgi:hypothetical protein